MTLHLLTLAHLLATIVWVGGMFFAHQCLRPATIAVLEPPARLMLWNAVFGRFFPWVWGSVIVLIVSGQVLVHQLSGITELPLQIHIMAGLGYLMTAIFVFIYFVPYAAMKRSMAAQDWPAAAAALNRIRMLVGTNLILGIVNVSTIFLLPLLM